jgi:fructose-1,6-bisphosphatase I
MLLQSVQLACKVIANACKKAGIANLYGVDGGENSSGDAQKKLDVLSNDVFINAVKFSDQVSVIGSEENEHAIIVSDKKEQTYAIVFDPLDGSSNIDANVSVGSIFGIYAKQKESGKSGLSELLRPGSELIAAGYSLYGAATMIVLTTGLGVNCFTLDPTIGEFILTHPMMKIPKKGKIYSINEGNSKYFDPAVTKALHKWKFSKKPKKARYIGSAVGDIHRTILYGGIFLYPSDSKNLNGKLRILYESNPMAMLIEQAGGIATTGRQRILDIQPEQLHQRCPVILGSRDDVNEVIELYKSEKVGCPLYKLASANIRSKM